MFLPAFEDSYWASINNFHIFSASSHGWMFWFWVTDPMPMFNRVDLMITEIQTQHDRRLGVPGGNPFRCGHFLGESSATESQTYFRFVIILHIWTWRSDVRLS